MFTAGIAREPWSRCVQQQQKHVVALLPLCKQKHFIFSLPPRVFPRVRDKILVFRQKLHLR